MTCISRASSISQQKQPDCTRKDEKAPVTMATGAFILGDILKLHIQTPLLGGSAQYDQISAPLAPSTSFARSCLL